MRRKLALFLLVNWYRMPQWLFNGFVQPTIREWRESGEKGLKQ